MTQNDKIIGINIKLYRDRLGFSQENISSFLGVKREMLSYYENGQRAIPVTLLEKLADIFGVELMDLLEEDSSMNQANICLAFRADSLEQNDMEVIASFKKIVKNYIKISKMDEK